MFGLGNAKSSTGNLRVRRDRTKFRLGNARSNAGSVRVSLVNTKFRLGNTKYWDSGCNTSSSTGKLRESLGNAQLEYES